MNPETWRELQNLFLEVRELAGDERRAVLEERAIRDPELVEEVLSLLAADADPGVMDDLAPHLPPLSRVAPHPAPQRIGPYRVVAVIGRGGMGVVLLAERADGQFEQQVAIKLVDSADAADPLHQRFLNERQILAGLTHPNIARLLDGGITDDGRPFLVMEYVDGVPVTTWCDRHDLDIRSRLQLFAEICTAVQHAHASLVVHRDLKPGNILVSSDGRVHLLDFGIAKLIEPAPDTASGAPVDQRTMTLEYASPEQVRGEPLTTASDLYSLGVLLHELLTGTSPYRLTARTPPALAAAVCEQEPERPSVRVSGSTPARRARQLEGDLDAIVLMALRKEPERRYASADMLRQDVERHLAGLPVLAHPDSRRYRIRKFVGRHRVEVAAAVIVLVTLLAGLGVSIAAGRRATLERDRAAQALAESEVVTRFLLEMYQTGEPGEPGELPQTQLSALDLLRRGAQRANELAGEPIVHARLLDVVGQLSMHLGQLDDARRQLEQAVAIRRATLGARSLDLATSLIHLSWVQRARADYDAARTLAAEALEIRQNALPAGHPDIGDALYELGWVNGGPYQETLYRQALAILSANGAATERGVAVLRAISTNLRRQGRLAEAVDAGREALRMAEQAFGPDHHATGAAMIHLADHVNDIEQDAATAERLYRRGLDLLTDAFGENNTRLIHGLHSLAGLLGERGDAEAEVLLRRALAIRRTAAGSENAGVAEELQLLAKELARQRRFDEAETLARQAIDLTARTLGPDHPAITNQHLPVLAEILDLDGRHAAADSTYQAAIDRSPGENVFTAQLHRGFGRMLLRRADYPRAEAHLLDSLAQMERAYGGAEHPNLQETKRALMELYQLWGRPDLVERYRVPPGRFVPY